MRKNMPLGDLSGRKFGRLLAIEENGKDKYGRKTYLCECDCKEKTRITIMQYYLTSGAVKSCGCLSKETTSSMFKQYNVYDLTSQEYAIGYTKKNEEFIFSKEDYELIRFIFWRYNSDGYLVGFHSEMKRDIRMNRLILGLLEKSVKILAEHKNRNKGDNRRENLREATFRQNNMNQSVQKKSKTGVTGVNYSEKADKYWARIILHRKNMTLGFFDNFDDAVRARLWGERKYFGQYAPQIHLWEQYGIPPLEEN